MLEILYPDHIFPSSVTEVTLSVDNLFCSTFQKRAEYISKMS